MKPISRRKLITSGLAAAAGFSGLAVAGRMARRYGLIPPDCGGIYGAGENTHLRCPEGLDATLARTGIPAQHDIENAVCKRSCAS